MWPLLRRRSPSAGKAPSAGTPLLRPCWPKPLRARPRISSRSTSQSPSMIRALRTRDCSRKPPPRRRVVHSTRAPECGLMFFTVTADHISDALLVRRCRSGDPEAWTQLVERFSRYVYAIAVQGYRLSSHDAEDAFQEVFTRVYDRLDSLRNDAAFRPWIAQLTRRVCLDRLRVETREEPVEEVELPDASDVLTELDEAFTVHEALARLSEDCREVLDRFFARDESYR